MTPIKSYLFLYNLTCCIGWLALLYLMFSSLNFSSSSFSLANFRKIFSSTLNLPHVATTVLIVQFLAILEVFHSIFHFVKSPAIITTIQVGSRVACLVVLLLHWNHDTHRTSYVSTGLLLLSWTLSEIPRYLFYICSLLQSSTYISTIPWIVFYLRYSLFLFFYPLGITCEVYIYYHASINPTFSPISPSIFQLLILLYIPGSFLMISNMVSNRNRAFKKRNYPEVLQGIVWPNDPKTNKRSSTYTSKLIVSAALSSVCPDGAKKVYKERSWRFGYIHHFQKVLEASRISNENALKIALEGLKKAYDLFEFIHEDGRVTSFQDAMSYPTNKTYHTGIIHGSNKDSTYPPALPIPYKNQLLTGTALQSQVQAWIKNGVMEKSAGEAIVQACVSHSDTYLNLSQQLFILLGAGSAMGPYELLLKLGANIVAIDINTSHVWKRLIQLARHSAGSIYFPMSSNQSCDDPTTIDYTLLGANLLTQTPIIRNWLLSFLSRYPHHRFVIGSYAYLNGAKHVQVSLAMDAIVQSIQLKYPYQTSLAYLCTPTDLHIMNNEAYHASCNQYNLYNQKLYCQLVRLFSRHYYLRPNVKTRQTYHYVRGLSIAQGPNYALAKKLQYWRALLARSQGCVVSSNIAPATSTQSVIHNRTFHWAYQGMPYFQPLEIFEPSTSNAIMTALLCVDLQSSNSVSQPTTSLSHVMEMFIDKSVHGGAWRCAYSMDSLGEASVFVYFARCVKKWISMLLGIGIVCVAIIIQVKKVVV